MEVAKWKEPSPYLDAVDVKKMSPISKSMLKAN